MKKFFFLLSTLLCLKIEFLTRNLMGQEDCLVANVYTDNLMKKDLKAVMVWIHGGGYFAGDGIDFYGPEHLMDEDIVRKLLIICRPIIIGHLICK